MIIGGVKVLTDVDFFVSFFVENFWISQSDQRNFDDLKMPAQHFLGGQGVFVPTNTIHQHNKCKNAFGKHKTIQYQMGTSPQIGFFL